MNRLRKHLVALMTAALFPLAATGALAMQHGEHGGSMDHNHMEKSSMGHEGMEHGSMNHEGMEHGGMGMHGDMIMLGDSVQEGVKAMAHLKDVREAMGKMGMKSTHHLMIMFADQGTGKPIESGAAAVKIKGPKGEESQAIQLMGMQGHFGADIELDEPGAYHFTVGTKLADGTKRQFEFDYTLK